MAISQNKTFVLSPTLALCLALIGAASMTYYYQGLFIPRSLAVRQANNLGGGVSFGNDFYQIWLASRQWLHQRRDPYSPEMTREIQIGLYGRTLDSSRPQDPKDQRIFPYPVFAEFLFWPAALFPFALVRVAVLFTLVPLTFATILLWMRALFWHLDWRWFTVLTLLVLCSYPALEGFYADQIGLLVGFLFAASILSLRRGKLLQSGVLLALTTVKPQVTALAILYLLMWAIHRWPKRKPFCTGFLTTLFFLVGGSTLVWPHWISSWLHVVVLYHGYTGRTLIQELLTTPFGALGAVVPALFVTAALIVVAALLAVRNRTAASDSLEFWQTLSILLAITTIALLPGQAVYDHGILLPGIFLIVLSWQKLSSSLISKALRYTGLAITLWPWIAALFLIALRPFLTHSHFYSKAIFALPLRTAAVFPFIVLGLLLLVTLSQRSPAELTSSSAISVQQ